MFRRTFESPTRANRNEDIFDHVGSSDSDWMEEDNVESNNGGKQQRRQATTATTATSDNGNNGGKQQRRRQVGSAPNPRGVGTSNFVKEEQ
jgi:hypothetical protein